jgi:hypothetical protein
MSMQNLMLFYIVIVMGFIAANLFLIIRRRRYDQEEVKIRDYWVRLFRKCLSAEQYGIENRILRRLEKENWLTGFYDACHEMDVRDSRMRKIITANKEEILKACARYGKSNLTMRAYFAYFCSGLKMNPPEEYNEYTKLMLSYLKDRSVFCRENALEALYSFGNAEAVSRAFHLLSEEHIYHSEKLLSDGLMSFAGDVKELETQLIREFAELDECYQVAVVNFLRYTGNAAYDRQLLETFRREDSGKDLKCSILRLLSRQDSEEIRAEICRILRDCNNTDWEVTAVAANAAGSLAGSEVMEALFISLTSRHWYVRINSAKSLAKQNMNHEMITALLNGSDRFAKEELLYELVKTGRMAYR